MGVCSTTGSEGQVGLIRRSLTMPPTKLGEPNSASRDYAAHPLRDLKFF